MRPTSNLKMILFWDKIKWPSLSITVLGLLGLSLFMIFREGVPSIVKTPKEKRVHSNIADNIYKKIEAGHYDTAIDNFELELKKNPRDVSLKHLKSLLMDELKIDFKFKYLPGRRRETTMRVLSADLVLTQEDPYYLTVHASDHCFLYIYQIDNSNNLTQLFPNSSFVPTTNPIPPGPLRIPDGFDWFYLDDVPGVETIYLVVSRWRQKELEELSKSFETVLDNAEARRQLLKRFLARLQVEEQATDDLPGLVYGKYQFTHK